MQIQTSLSLYHSKYPKDFEFSKFSSATVKPKKTERRSHVSGKIEMLFKLNNTKNVTLLTISIIVIVQANAIVLLGVAGGGLCSRTS